VAKSDQKTLKVGIHSFTLLDA